MRQLAPAKALLTDPFQFAALLSDNCIVIYKTPNHCPALGTTIYPAGNSGHSAVVIGILDNPGDGYVRTKTEDARELDGDSARVHNFNPFD